MPRASAVHASRVEGGSAGEADTTSEALHLVAGQLAPLAGREPAGVEARVADALGAAHRVADCLAHAPDLAVAALVQRQLDRPGAHAAHLGGRGRAVVQLDADAESVERLFVRVAGDAGAVHLLD